MKAVPFSDILAETCQLIGLDRSTLNDKGFCTIRDLVSRRLGTIWDREEWPDTERWLKAYPGVPATGIAAVDTSIVSNAGDAIVDENGNTIVYSAGDEMEVTFTLSRESKAVLLMDFEENAYRNGTVGSTKLKLTQPLFVQETDGTITELNDEYEFTYTEESLENGKRAIATVTITVPNGILLGADGQTNVETSAAIADTFGGSSIVFLKNPQFLVRICDEQSSSATGVNFLEAYSADPRLSTRTAVSPFIIEDFQPWERLGDEIQNLGSTHVRFFDSAPKFIKYRIPYRQFTGRKFDAASSYSVGTQVYYDPFQQSALYQPTDKTKKVAGDFWENQSQAYAGQAPSYSNSVWRKIEIPLRFKNYIVNAVSADFLRSEGRAEEAVVFDQLAEVAVQQQIDVLLRQQGQNQRLNMVFTY